jgi:hypothetical protein
MGGDVIRQTLLYLARVQEEQRFSSECRQKAEKQKHRKKFFAAYVGIDQANRCGVRETIQNGNLFALYLSLSNPQKWNSNSFSRSLRMHSTLS